MSRWTACVLALFLAILTLGCGDNREKGANKGLDKPTPEPKK